MNKNQLPDASHRHGRGDEPNMFIFCKSGIVQDYCYDGKRGMLVARGEKAAKKLARRLHISPARIGSVEGEKLEKHIEAAATRGCDGCWLMTGRGIHWCGFPAVMFGQP